MLLEVALGGELFTHLRAETKFALEKATLYAAQVTSAFAYLHARRIAHRDLKPENLLFDSEGYLKVVDFGFAKRIDERTWTVCGTPEYMAPEIILNKGHDKAVDWWTLGILIYEMLVGYPPFEGADPMALYKNIVANELTFPSMLGQQALEMIKGLLTSDPAERLGNQKDGADDIKRHTFHKKIVWPSLFQKKIEAPFKPVIKSAMDASNFDQFEDPDAGKMKLPKTYPKATFSEFSQLTASYSASPQ